MYTIKTEINGNQVVEMDDQFDIIDAAMELILNENLDKVIIYRKNKPFMKVVPTSSEDFAVLGI